MMLNVVIFFFYNNVSFVKS